MCIEKCSRLLSVLFALVLFYSQAKFALVCVRGFSTQPDNISANKKVHGKISGGNAGKYDGVGWLKVLGIDELDECCFETNLFRCQNFLFWRMQVTSRSLTTDSDFSSDLVYNLFGNYINILVQAIESALFKFSIYQAYFY